MRILIVDYEFPEYNASSGGLRLEQMIRIFLNAGYEVTFLSIDYFLHPPNSKQVPRYKEYLESLGVICYQSLNDELPSKFSHELKKKFDVCIICRYYMFNRYAKCIRDITACKTLILDTVDAHYVREQRKEKVLGESGHWKATKHLECEAVNDADIVWTVSQEDASAFQRKDIRIVPNIYPKNNNKLMSFSDRTGIVFIGNYKHDPNLDAVKWFVSDILPIINRVMPEQEFYAGGAYSKGSIDIIKTKGYRYFQWQADLFPFLGERLVGVAPLRYGSGVKGKIGSYMSAGLPVVTTSIGAEGLESDSTVIVEDDVEQFAYSLMALCRSQQLWQRKSKLSLKYVDSYSLESLTPTVLSALSF